MFSCLLSPVSCLLSTDARAEGAAPPHAALSTMVGRLSAASTPTARDWAELARETITWGSRLRSEQVPVPEGPVRDALSAVGLGSQLDARTADWPKLREELEALLKKDDEKKEPQQQQQNDQNQQQQNKDQQQQNQDQKKQDQQNQSAQKSPDSQQQQQQQPQNQSQSNPAQPQDQNQKDHNEAQKPPESAFGDMKRHEPPPPPQDQSQPDTQKVGGEKDQRPAEPVDPSLAVPLQKLEQLRSQDSPARLFQLMEGERKPTDKKPAKDW